MHLHSALNITQQFVHDRWARQASSVVTTWLLQHRGITAVQVTLSLRPNQADVLLVSVGELVKQAYTRSCAVFYYSMGRHGPWSRCSINPVRTNSLSILLFSIRLRFMLNARLCARYKFFILLCALVWGTRNSCKNVTMHLFQWHLINVISCDHHHVLRRMHSCIHASMMWCMADLVPMSGRCLVYIEPFSQWSSFSHAQRYCDTKIWPIRLLRVADADRECGRYELWPIWMSWRTLPILPSWQHENNLRDTRYQGQ